jgi:PEP-CTERM motif
MERWAKRIGLVIVLAGLMLVPARRIEAAVTTYTSSAAFDSAISGYSTFTENYGGLSAGTTISAGQTVDGITYTAFTPGPLGTLLGGIVTNQFNSFTGNSLGGNQNSGQQYFFGGDSVTVTFAAPVNAFGLFFNVNANSGDYGFSTSLGTATTGSATFDTRSFVFAGLVSTDATFTSATFFSTNTAVGSYNVPEIITASVPEPSGLCLLGLGALGLIGYSCRAARKAAIRSSAQA